MSEATTHAGREAERADKAKALIPPPGSEDRDFWLEAAVQHGFEETAGGEHMPEYDPPAYFATADEVLALMASARQQGRDDVAASAPASGAERMTAGEARVGRRVARNVYWRDEPLFTAATPELAAEIVSRLNATPAPATPPGVPDSVREAVARLVNPTAFFTGPEAFGIPNEEDPRWKRTLVYGGRLSAYEKAEKIIALLATHPAGQSAGSGAVKRSVEHAPQGGATTLARHNKSAPVSTRTGDEGTEDGARMLWACYQIARYGGSDPSHMWAQAPDETKRIWGAVYKRSLAACPASPEAQGAWSFDMEAAPRDGQPFLMAFDKGKHGDICRAPAVVFWGEGSQRWRYWHTVQAPIRNVPIAWQPLPAPPSSGQGGR